MTPIKYISRTIILLVGLAIATSCVRENLDNCPSPAFRIQFSYDQLNTQDKTGIDPTKVKDVSVFVFDKYDKYIGTFTDKNITFSESYYMEIKTLPAGTYRFVSWLNANNDDYSYNFDLFNKSTTRTQISEMLINLNIPADNIIRYDIQQLFHGFSTTATVGQTTDTHTQVITIPVVENTTRVNFTVEGLTPDNGAYCFNIKDNNGSYGFGNSFAPCRQFNHKKSTTFDQDGKLRASFILLLLKEDRNPILDITHEQSSLGVFTGVDLVSLIEQTKTLLGAKIDYQRIYQFDINIKFLSETNVEITINDWVFNIEHQEL